MLKTFKKNLFKEPRQGMSDRVGVFFGCFALLIGCAIVVYGLPGFGFSRYGGLLLDSLLVSQS